ncbi:MAG: hypothetical protein ACOC85_04770 [Thermoplasmatota archaeon]
MNLFEDELNLKILRYLVSGKGVKANISALSRRVDIHRATTKRRVESLYELGIINPPQYSFPQIFKEYPLLVVVKADMPRSIEVNNFYQDDSHIFAAFSCMEGPYNTLLIEFFEDLESYHFWRKNIIKERKIPSRKTRNPAHAYIFSNKLAFKYEPNCFIRDMRANFEEKDEIILNGNVLDKTTFPILENIMKGNCIRTNDSYLARELGSNRKTIKRRINKLLENGIIEGPRCYFSNLLIPPGYNLIVSMIEVTSKEKEIKEYIQSDDNIPRALETSTGRYNFLIFSAFPTIEEFFDWGERLNSKFQDSLGGISNTILSSRMIHTIKPQKVSLGWIERKLWNLKQEG